VVLLYTYSIILKDKKFSRIDVVRRRFQTNIMVDYKNLGKIGLGTYLGYTFWSNLTRNDTYTIPALKAKSPKVLVVGAGFGGVCMSIKLAEKGIDHIVVEKEENLGGTWFLTRYPGAQCDVPSHQYCYSFEMNSEWSHAYAGSNEIYAYLSRVADKYKVW
jgi:hypothetical protein